MLKTIILVNKIKLIKAPKKINNSTKLVLLNMLNILNGCSNSI